MEQFSCCLQFVDLQLNVQNIFWGVYNAPDTAAEILFLRIKDVFTRLNLPLKRLQGYCFDGAANASGRINGVQAKLKTENLGSFHCSNQPRTHQRSQKLKKRGEDNFFH